MSLTDAKTRNAKPKDKQYKLTDGDGLFLLVMPAGGKWWRFKYHFEGKEKLLSFGTYPEVSLSDARNKRADARKQVAAGINPSDVRKAQKAAFTAQTEHSFEAVAREWHGKFSPTWATGHAETTMKRMKRDLFPWVGARPIGELRAFEILAALRRVESRGALDTAHRVRTIAGQVFRYAVATGRAERDPTSDLKGALPPAQRSHLAAMTEPDKVADLLRTIDGYEGGFVVKCALKLAPMLFVRPGELRRAEWAEIDLDAAQWNIPAERMKMKLPHIVPLSTQAVEILNELKALTGAVAMYSPAGVLLPDP